MERDKIIKALECCSDDNSCYTMGCPYKSDEVSACTTKMSRDALALIKELTEENERLNQIITQLGKNNDEIARVYLLAIKEAKADTVRKMQERLKEEFADDSIHGQSEIYCVVDHIANEVLGEKK